MTRPEIEKNTISSGLVSFELRHYVKLGNWKKPRINNWADVLKIPVFVIILSLYMGK